MKRQELKDRLIGLADGMNDQSTALTMLTHLEDLVDLIREEGLEGEVRESGLKPTLAKGEYVAPTGNSGRGTIEINPALIPPGPQMQFEVTGADIEIDVMIACTRAMEAANPQSRQRIARYLADRFEVS